MRDPYSRLQALNLEAPFSRGDVVINTLWGQLLLKWRGFPARGVELDEDGRDAVRRLVARIGGWEKRESARL